MDSPTKLIFLDIARDLETAGLLWTPEIGDEVLVRKFQTQISVLVDPAGMTPPELRQVYLWLPSVEQMVLQLEARQAILAHAGLELSTSQIGYRTVIETGIGVFESRGQTLRDSLGLGLRRFLLQGSNSIN